MRRRVNCANAFSGSSSRKASRCPSQPGPSISMGNLIDQTLTSLLASLKPGKALDLAAGSGRHSRWLAERGWGVTAVDIQIEQIPDVHCIRADLENHEYRIAADSW